jgi:hypothetical protein
VPDCKSDPISGRAGLDGTWAATALGAPSNVWATALSVNTLMSVGQPTGTLSAPLEALVQWRPLETRLIVRLKFRLSDRKVRFDPGKYGWGWVRETMSWVVPTLMALITLERARRRGLIGGRDLEKRLQLGTEMLLDRA